MQKKIHHGSTLKVQNLGEEMKWMKSGQWLSLGAGEWEKPWGWGRDIFLLFFFPSFLQETQLLLFFYGENTQYKIYNLNPFLHVQYIIHYMYNISTADL